jgi:hypothetical protein
LIEAQIVSRRREDRGVGCESKSGQRTAAAGIADHVFRGYVLRIGRASAVAAEEQRAPAPQDTGVTQRHARYGSTH